VLLPIQNRGKWPLVFFFGTYLRGASVINLFLSECLNHSGSNPKPVRVKKLYYRAVETIKLFQESFL
jgi:hypothetical protein